jgi:short-subunit dehydrogenase
MAVALLARNKSNLDSLRDSLRNQVPNSTFHSFATDTSPTSLRKAFSDISSHPELKDLKLKLAVFHVKHSSKGPFMQSTPEEYGESLQIYATGAMAFGQEAAKMMFDQNGGETELKDTNGQKKGTIIFTGTLGALRTNGEISVPRCRDYYANSR